MLFTESKHTNYSSHRCYLRFSLRWSQIDWVWPLKFCNFQVLVENSKPTLEIEWCNIFLPHLTHHKHLYISIISFDIVTSIIIFINDNISHHFKLIDFSLQSLSNEYYQYYHKFAITPTKITVYNNIQLFRSFHC